MEIGTYINAANQQFEEIEDEELWEDGELSVLDVMHKIEHRVLVKGDWKLIRRIDG
tara:strand:+ start:229 stop:396 length:168 start_codon:yes stop_codon:yes gene_type:complete